jgi:hypothetical protein
MRFDLLADAMIEQGDDSEVIRAKYFIRDEFLVSKDDEIDEKFELLRQLEKRFDL